MTDPRTELIQLAARLRLDTREEEPEEYPGGVRLRGRVEGNGQAVLLERRIDGGICIYQTSGAALKVGDQIVPSHTYTVPRAATQETR